MNKIGSLWGKILGACFGFAIAGPFGAFVGIFVGSFFDKGINFSHGIDPKALRGETRRIFHFATFSVMGLIAKADGHVSEDEIRTAKKMMENLNLNTSEEKEAIASFTQGKSAGYSLNLVLAELKHACREKPTLLRIFVEMQYQAATMHGYKVDLRKQRALNTVFEQLGFLPIFKFYQQYQNHQQYHYQRSSQNHSQYQPQSVNELANAYTLLGVSENSTAIEVKKAYRKQMGKHHPDKLIAKGLSEKEIKKGTEYAQKIQAAYERIRQFRGF